MLRSLTVAISLALVVSMAEAAGDKPDRGPCPENWHLKAPEERHEGGSIFTCVPDRPATRVTCHPDTEYFEEDCAFGCEVPPDIPK